MLAGSDLAISAARRAFSSSRWQGSADLCPRGTGGAGRPHRELAAVGGLAGDHLAEGEQFQGLLP